FEPQRQPPRNVASWVCQQSRSSACCSAVSHSFLSGDSPSGTKPQEPVSPCTLRKYQATPLALWVSWPPSALPVSVSTSSVGASAATSRVSEPVSRQPRSRFFLSQSWGGMASPESEYRSRKHRVQPSRSLMATFVFTPFHL